MPISRDPCFRNDERKLRVPLYYALVFLADECFDRTMRDHRESSSAIALFRHLPRDVLKFKLLDVFFGMFQILKSRIKKHF